MSDLSSLQLTPTVPSQPSPGAALDLREVLSKLKNHLTDIFEWMVEKEDENPEETVEKWPIHEMIKAIELLDTNGVDINERLVDENFFEHIKFRHSLVGLLKPFPDGRLGEIQLLKQDLDDGKLDSSSNISYDLLKKAVNSAKENYDLVEEHLQKRSKAGMPWWTETYRVYRDRLASSEAHDVEDGVDEEKSFLNWARSDRILPHILADVGTDGGTGGEAGSVQTGHYDPQTGGIGSISNAEMDTGSGHQAFTGDIATVVVASKNASSNRQDLQDALMDSWLSFGDTASLTGYPITLS
ncbi:hypothetical protein QFC19_000130 [Naganishia cerealis]|uniref:Uncharacterized protein n=1 Tax=Naganishia cerealis TaxID=610337 RepID=A0ACC2WQ77_9TREE|nr:hypothetical protein QFC19_000130 [Naganishia cerealis]